MDTTINSKFTKVRGRRFLQPLALAALRLMGWKVDGSLPTVNKFVMIVAPHTSNWDLPIGLICAHALGLMYAWRLGFMAKAEAFKGPLGPMLTWLGGLPINRRLPRGVIEQMTGAFAAHDRLMLVITPEGTRKRTDSWKSGFYRIATEANVPIVMAYIDYGQRMAGIGPTLHPSGNLQADMEIIAAFFADKQAMHPHEFGPVRVRET